MRFRILAAFLAFMVLWPLSTVADVWTVDNLEMVHLKDRTKYVCDPDGLLSVACRDSADKVLDSLRRGCGIQSVFVIVNRVKSGDTYRLAQDLGNKYGVGDKNTRRGLVIVIAVKDRRYTVSPGQGLEADLTDVECDRIARAYIIPNMKANNSDGAVLATSQALLAKFKTGKLPLPKDTEGEEMTQGEWISIIILLILFFSIPLFLFIQFVLLQMGILKKPWVDIKKLNNNNRNRRNDRDDFPPFIFMGGGGSRGGGGPIGGSFGGGTFGGGGSSGGW